MIEDFLDMMDANGLQGDIIIKCHKGGCPHLQGKACQSPYACPWMDVVIIQDEDDNWRYA